METSGDSGQSEPGPSNASWCPTDFMEKLQSVSLAPRKETLSGRGSACDEDKAELSSQTASQVLWSIGTLSSPIPNGFYSIIPDKNLKELFDTIPSPDDLYSLGAEGLKADIILVDAEKDKKLSMLKQLSTALVKGLSTNPALLIKKIAGLVVYAVANEGTRMVIPEGPLGKLISACWAEPKERPSCQEILTRLLDCEYTLC